MSTNFRSACGSRLAAMCILEARPDRRGLVLVCFTAVFALSLLLRRSQTIPTHLPWAGRKHNGYLQSIRSYLRSIAGTHKMLEEGRCGFLSSVGIHDQPDNVLSGFEAHREFMRADWTLLHPTIIHEHIFQAVISKQLTRHLDELEDELRAEIPIALETHITPNGNEWHEVDGYKSWKKTILQVNTLITWAIEDAYEAKSAGASDKTSLDFLAARLSVMNFVSIDSTTITLGNVLFDILYHPWEAPTGSSPSKKPLLERLRDEARIACQTSTSTRRATDSVPMLDACLRESFRMGNFVSRTTVKMVTQAPGVEVPGVGFVKQGVKVGVPLWGIHHDGDIYDDPWRWRMSRWLKADGRSSSVPLFGGNASESGQQYLPFGYRRSAW
nr:putative cytochrome p450 [Quercus suber]